MQFPMYRIDFVLQPMHWPYLCQLLCPIRLTRGVQRRRLDNYSILFSLFYGPLESPEWMWSHAREIGSKPPPGEFKMDGCRNCLRPKGFVQTWGIPGFHSVWPGILFPLFFEHNLNLRFWVSTSFKQTQHVRYNTVACSAAISALARGTWWLDVIGMIGYVERQPPRKDEQENPTLK